MARKNALLFIVESRNGEQNTAINTKTETEFRAPFISF